MKSASKPKDFSINSILADVSFQNDQYKKASVSSVSAMCQNDIQKEKYERKSATAFKINVEDKVGLNTKNNVMSVKKETNFDITSNKMYLINNVCNNDESETKNYGVSPQRRSEVEAEGKYDHHEQCTYLLNTEENIIIKIFNKIENLESMENIVELEWLQCTRYKPPKIPRKSAVGKNKRKPSLHPRIPFSTFQLDFLEQQFRSSAYLSKQDVLKISNVLNLSANRIKIWFQNRRARERREICTNV
ncbi:PREDICTED: homeobox protein MSX-2 [Eufriesea mexicana]|uniref:homeobox protein MSX-2 n=1 Tax=Eufriesea mexicana TaxID=516756 RepID=UPI00083BFF1D|nr:PREDICTED: homeobox protein MSX-2 [Eufriesea mexicana]